MIDAETAAALQALQPRQRRPYRTFLEDLARVAVMLDPLGRDGSGYETARVRGNGAKHDYMGPNRSRGITPRWTPFGPPPRPWEQELKRIRAFTGLAHE